MFVQRIPGKPTLSDFDRPRWGTADHDCPRSAAFIFHLVQLEGLALFGASGFKSPLPHQITKRLDFSGLFSFLASTSGLWHEPYGILTPDAQTDPDSNRITRLDYEICRHDLEHDVQKPVSVEIRPWEAQVQEGSCKSGVGSHSVRLRR